MESSIAAGSGELLENGFSEYKQLILSELKQQREDGIAIRNSFDALKSEISRDRQETRVEIAQLKIKAGIWGFAGSSLPVIAYLLFEYMKKGV